MWRKIIVSTYDNIYNQKHYVAEFEYVRDNYWILIEVKTNLGFVLIKESLLQSKLYADHMSLVFIAPSDKIEIDDSEFLKDYLKAVESSEIKIFLDHIVNYVRENGLIIINNIPKIPIKKTSNNINWGVEQFNYLDIKLLIHKMAFAQNLVMLQAVLLEEYHNLPLKEIRAWKIRYYNNKLLFASVKANDLFLSYATGLNGEMLLPSPELIYCDDSGTRYSPIIKI